MWSSNQSFWHANSADILLKLPTRIWTGCIYRVTCIGSNARYVISAFFMYVNSWREADILQANVGRCLVIHCCEASAGYGLEAAETHVHCLAALLYARHVEDSSDVISFVQCMVNLA